MFCFILLSILLPSFPTTIVDDFFSHSHFSLIGYDASVSVRWFFFVFCFLCFSHAFVRSWSSPSAALFLLFRTIRNKPEKQKRSDICSRWVIRNCGNLSIRCTARSWDSAATTRLERQHPSFVASALLPARRPLSPKSIKSSRPFLCSN